MSAWHRTAARLCALSLALVALACDEDDGPPPQCNADWVASAGFDFDAGDLIDPTHAIIELNYQASCVVDSMTANGEAMSTALSCDDGSGVRPISISTRIADGSPPPWAVADTLHVNLTDYYEDIGRESKGLVVRDSDDRLLFTGIDKGYVPAESIAPLTATADMMLCAPPGWTFGNGVSVPIALTFTLAGESIQVFDGQIGELSDPEGGHYVIYVVDAEVSGSIGEDGVWNYLVIQYVPG